MTQSDQLVTNPPRTFYLIFVIDTSGSMYGERIASVNEALARVICDLRECQNQEQDIEIRIAILTFNNTVKWLTKGAEKVDEILLSPIEVSGVTAMGEVLFELEATLTRRVLFKNTCLRCPPFILFVTDGNPTDNWKDPLERLQQNKWYNKALKMGIVCGQADKEVLSRVVGDSNSVIETKDSSQLSDALYSLSMNSFDLCCALDDAPATEKQYAVPTSSLIKQLQEELDSENGVW